MCRKLKTMSEAYQTCSDRLGSPANIKQLYWMELTRSTELLAFRAIERATDGAIE